MHNRSIPDPMPVNPHDAIAAFRDCRRRAERMLADATTIQDRRDAEFWIDNADRNIFKWQAAAEREVGR